MANKWMKTLNKLDGAVDREYNPYAPENVVSFTSPSVNYIFPKSWGWDITSSNILLYGKPKAGKSVLTYDLVGNIHKKYPDAIVVRFDTELRETGKLEDFWGIDQDRYVTYKVNEPGKIFDRITNELIPLVEEGMPLKAIIIDSLSAILGVKTMNSDSVESHTIGDWALSIKKGLSLISAPLKRNKIGLVATAHVSANINAGPYGPKEKLQMSWYGRHFFEHYIQVSRNNSADTTKTLDGDLLADVKDFKGKKEKLGHKIYVKMEESTGGVSGRTGMFTFSYTQGVINTEEEIFELSKLLGVVERPNNRTYIFNGESFSSKNEFYKAIKENEELRNELLLKIQLKLHNREYR